MSQSASQAAAFFRDVARTGRLWTVRDEGGYPAPYGSTGGRAQPFWSTESRVRRIIKLVPAYAAFDAEELDLTQWRDHWLPNFRKSGIRLGINWSGPRAAGYDFTPDEVQNRLAAQGLATWSRPPAEG
ncbi:DUF2750 domain-containing protein [Kribbella sp. NPDC000426]|uniref:DUF2750 domain-containing protein n=1 Tax=Kribbella sp. NPDC000426 TaxID=3154255 RepID=UPI00332B64C1